LPKHILIIINCPLRLDAMAAVLADQREQAAYTGLGFDERDVFSLSS
jgi:hypothetical protein